MPNELTPFAVELIQRCPQLINRFAEKINSMINNWHDDEQEEKLEPVYITRPACATDIREIQELISHVGYDKAQCGYDK